MKNKDIVKRLSQLKKSGFDIVMNIQNNYFIAVSYDCVTSEDRLSLFLEDTYIDTFFDIEEILIFLAKHNRARTKIDLALNKLEKSNYIKNIFVYTTYCNEVLGREYDKLSDLVYDEEEEEEIVDFIPAGGYSRYFTYEQAIKNLKSDKPDKQLVAYLLL